MSKPLAIDLFCGKGGWTNALLDVGFRVIGFDINPQPDYRGEFVRRDILTMTEIWTLDPIEFAVCSSPCEQFSVHCMKHFHKNPPYPELGIKLFNHSRNLLESLGIPYVMENVRCAEKFVGRSVNHCGPFYLWGNAVPAVFPRECYKIVKQTRMTPGNKFVRMQREAKNQEELRAYRLKYQKDFEERSGGRSKCAATTAMIPYPIARAVAEGAMNLVRQAA